MSFNIFAEMPLLGYMGYICHSAYWHGRYFIWMGALFGFGHQTAQRRSSLTIDNEVNPTLLRKCWLNDNETQHRSRKVLQHKSQIECKGIRKFQVSADFRYSSSQPAALPPRFSAVFKGTGKLGKFRCDD